MPERHQLTEGERQYAALLLAWSRTMHVHGINDFDRWCRWVSQWLNK